ncbi:LysR family transcriptional regulator [Vibrio sp. SCSIO 43137]|uniref:LysR family transcriptional regulator n=1 Tax=Vibrio sp. SCSIO 43137 TaxID=3021011 RepID=UPI00230730E2|nr:LysR substrate-binding domain-containing protein [Vibrio sp. SCSIO 43137]WCE31757.1 LysR substrate-binding domain-containing protein [Vibrio sp. SCSIO 43137]
MNRFRQMSLFAQIVESGSITAAADELLLSKSVVSQHLKSLETELGITLLKRTTRRQTLTPAGQEFYHSCKTLNQLAESAWAQAQESLDVPKGVVRITAPNALMETLVTPAVAELMRDYPQLEPELISSDSQLDLVAENIDLAIRVGMSKESSLKQRRIGEFRDVLCVGKSYKNSSDNKELSYIANSWQGRNISHTLQKPSGEVQELTYRARCITNSFHTTVSLIQSGAGMGLIPDFYLAIAEPMLCPVYPGDQLAVNPVYALHPYSQQVPLNVRVSLAAIEHQLNRQVVV